MGTVRLFSHARISIENGVPENTFFETSSREVAGTATVSPSAVNGNHFTANRMADQQLDTPSPDVINSAASDVQDLASQGLIGHSASSDPVLDQSISSLSVQQPTSDLREPVEPVSTQVATEIKDEKQQQDLQHDVELANGLANGDDLPIERILSSGPEPFSGNEDVMDTSVSESISTPIPNVTLPHHPAVPMPEGRLPEVPIDPAPTPVHPGTQPVQVDEVMQDVPKSPGKVARSRDDEDVEDEPVAKRSRTDDDGSAVPEFKVPEIPPPANNGANPDRPILRDAEQQRAPAEPLQPITKPQHKFLSKGLQNLKRLKDALPFNQPVDYVTLNIPTYPDVISKPMDLRTIEEKLKADQYASVGAYTADFNQIVENAVIFNGPEHPVTKSAYTIKAAFDKQLSNLPSPEIADPPAPDKKSKKAVVAPPAKAPPPRRESRSSLGGNARSPTAAASPQTFALGPQGVPLIRRDSTVGDGRPKREIHPPPPRDLPYANSKPKKKKYQWELKFCREAMTELMKPKYQGLGYPFYAPVDPVALNIPHYHKLIKKPMDLSTVESKLKQGEYENAKEFEADIRLMFANCYRFNPSTDLVHSLGKQFEGIFDEKWAERKQWIDDHAPASGPQSPGSSPEPEEEEEEEEEEDDEEENQLSILQKQIAAMSKQVEMIQKKKTTPPASTKKASKIGKPPKKEIKKSSSVAAIKSEKKVSSRPAKKEKIPYVTYEQKQDISNRINSLPETRMATALTIIRENMPNLKVKPQRPPVKACTNSFQGRSRGRNRA